MWGAGDRGMGKKEEVSGNAYRGFVREVMKCPKIDYNDGYTLYEYQVNCIL